MSERCSGCGSAQAQGSALCPRCLLERPLPALVLGDQLELGELIGAGGMGSVFRARDLRLQRDVAVKLLSTAAGAPGLGAERLEREARTLALLTHPNIVTVYQVAESDGQPFIAMELLTGGSLAEKLPLPAHDVARIGVELCDALAYAHARGVVHRDLKPHNVLFRDDGRAVLGDFGIARLRGEGAAGWTLTADGMVAGTPDYMAPEARKGAPPDPRMDLYALGVLLYEALTGELPRGAFARLPPAWDRVIRRALAPDPAERFADAAAFARALRGIDPAPPANDALSSDELSFMRAVAGMQTAASAVLLWALYLSATPRVLAADQLQPLIMLDSRPLPDGRIVSLARFEIGPMLGAVIASGLAVGCYALLRRHWRHEGLERVQPDQPVAASALVLGLGAFNVVGYGARLALQALGFAPAVAFIPILGGISEAVTVYLAWMTCLELWRRHRPLHREWRLWLGLALSAVPPVSELLHYLHRWRP